MKKNILLKLAGTLVSCMAVLLGCFLVVGGLDRMAQTAGEQLANGQALLEAESALAPQVVLENEEAVERRLAVKNLYQLPELPNGCEAVALTILLNYFEYPVDKSEIAYQYIPTVPFEFIGRAYFGADPETAYPGSPGPESIGYYCYPSVVVEGANRYLEETGGKHTAKDITGANETLLVRILDAGHPMMVWCTTDGFSPTFSTQAEWYKVGTETLFVPYTNMHVRVLTGYDENYFYFCDPLGEVAKQPRALFLHNFVQTGSRAVVLLEKDT